MILLFPALALCSEVNATQQQGQAPSTNTRKRSTQRTPKRYTPPQQQQEMDDAN
jgi:hypothetical protein